MDLDYNAISAHYKQTRERSMLLHSRLLKLLSQDDVREAASALGLLGKDAAIRFRTENETAILADYCIYSVLRGRKNLVDRCLEGGPGDFTSEERSHLEEMAKAHYTVIAIEDAEPGVGLHAIDPFVDEPSIFLADSLISTVARKGDAFATRLIPVSGYFMTSGAGLPVFPESRIAVFNSMKKVDLGRLVGLSRAREADLSSHIIRILLRAGTSDRVRYSTEQEELERRGGGKIHEVPPAGSRRANGADHAKGAHVGRNDPCPCGSGLKYKKCCG